MSGDYELYQGAYSGAEIDAALLKAEQSVTIRSTLTSSDDMDNLTMPGIYTAITGHLPANYPDTAGGRVLVVGTMGDTDQTTSFSWQAVSVRGVIWVRNKKGASTGGWYNWQRLAAVSPTTSGNKKISIVGDSISAYSGYSPDGYDTYYPSGNVTAVGSMWWKKLENYGYTILKNCSWAGSSVAGDDATGAIIASSDERVADLADGTTTPDIVICFIGTNDFARSYAIGTFTQATAIPTAANVADFAPAYAKMINKIMIAYPSAKVYACTLLQRNISGGTYPPVNGGGLSLSDYNDAIKNVAEYLGAGIIDLNKCGINFGNFSAYCAQETSGSYIHPNTAGQTLIADYIKRELTCKEALA